MKPYEACLNTVTTNHVTWDIVLAGDTENAGLVVSQIVIGGFNDLKMPYPETIAKPRRELKPIRKRL